ncbi:Aste57867_9110 [Aphanomyces stellatus]|uniref:Aste57867_9110 protein n=1 Tax=Aphanomyces stellatus TaxID=120398 RepID=A0A485KM69_9STRA|nr:hypothetical protein As57867_009074 [Aphanomyces stellatus]VFT85994.1 Aste57867_9110 [Aphanomyces stellatus]
MWDAVCRARKRVFNWAGQHQTLLVGTGVAVACGAGAYYMVHRVMNEAENMTKQMQRQILERQRLSVHLRRTEEECKAAFLRFLPSMKTRIYKQLDLEGIVESLKLLDKSEKETRDVLWEDAKLIGFTRLYTSIYAFCLLHVLMHCELLIIGRETFEKAKVKSESKDETTDDDTKETLVLQHQFLSSTMEYFFATGLPKLIASMEDKIGHDEILQAWHVHEMRSIERPDLEVLLQQLHVAAAIPAVEWQSFLIFPEDTTDSMPDSPWLNELRDILDSPFFHLALQDSMNTLFAQVQGQLLGALYNDKDSLPLAKVIPQLKTETAKCFKAVTTDAYWDDIARLESLQRLATSIFVQDDAVATSTWV